MPLGQRDKKKKQKTYKNEFKDVSLFSSMHNKIFSYYLLSLRRAFPQLSCDMYIMLVSFFEIRKCLSKVTTTNILALPLTVLKWGKSLSYFIFIFWDAQHFVESHFVGTTFGRIRRLVEVIFHRVRHSVEKNSQVRHSVEMVNSIILNKTT